MVMRYSGFRWFYLPYYLALQADGSYVVCNRRSQPVGMTTTSRVDYDAHPVKIRFRRFGPATAARLDCLGRQGLERIELYNEECIPTDSQAKWDAYSVRLQRLAALKVADGVAVSGGV